MSILFPEELIEEVRLANNIIDVISDFVVLKKKGRNYSGLCPFHHEKTPSFMVSPDKQIFHCFGCGVGGNVISFVMKKENLTFPETIRMLAEKAGISLPQRHDGLRDKKSQFKEKAFEINGLANEYFKYILSQKEAKLALDYLLNRGTSQDMIDRFKIGFALPIWDGLLNFLKDKGYNEEILARLGLILAKDRGNGYYDRFRNRIMFPIMDPRGKVVGFGGRVMDDSVPKYLNSPETELFNKSHLLFGLNLAAGAIREKDQVVIMEGYMDVVTAHQYGIRNAVASLGTALTKEQGKLLMRYTNNAVIAYDADQAGVKAAIRGMEILQDLGCQVNILTIPKGKDPDDFIKSQGPDAFEALIKNAKTIIEYKTIKLMEKIDTSRIEGKLAVVGELLTNLRNIETTVQREDAICIIADKLHISPQDVRFEFEKFIQKGRKNLVNRDNLAKSSYNMNMSAGNTDKMSTRSKDELGLLRLMLEDITIFEKVKQEIGLEFFQKLEYTNIVNLLDEKIKNTNVIRTSELVNFFAEDESAGRLITRILMQDLIYQDIYKAADALINSFKKADTESEKEKLLKEMAEAEKSGNIELATKLLLKYQTLL